MRNTARFGGQCRFYLLARAGFDLCQQVENLGSLISRSHYRF